MLPGKEKTVHFIGMGGYGMSALALMLLGRGYRVSGSDLKESALTATLREKGAAVYLGHDADNLGQPGLVVYSTAIAAGNPELAAARERKLPLWHRSELLASLLNASRGVAIAGAHGKTTTTALVGLLLEAGGLDPSVLIGGVLPAYGSNTRLGSGPYLVAEADESDRSFTRYYPHLALVTGTEADHLEHYDHDYEKLRRAYAHFLSQVAPEGAAVLCADDPYLVELAQTLPCPAFFYSARGGKALYGAREVVLEGEGSSFDFYRDSACLARGVYIGVPGEHNVSNALGALAAAHVLGLDPEQCAGILAAFRGVGRRFEVIARVGGVTVLDDYAHHPTEVRATLGAARLRGGRVLVLFQPHRYTRTAALAGEFSTAFDEADHLYLHRVYSAGEAPLPGAGSRDLAAMIRARGTVAVTYEEDMTTLEGLAAAEARPGDLLITMGAGDVTAAAPRLAALLRQRQGEGTL